VFPNSIQTRLQVVFGLLIGILFVLGARQRSVVLFKRSRSRGRVLIRAGVDRVLQPVGDMVGDHLDAGAQRLAAL
jgi:hypothetical protein